MAKKILIVDDEQDIVFVLKTAVEREGYEVSTAFDGLSALDMIEKERYDLIILDIMMPKFDGNSLNMRLKSNPQTALIPVIIITGRGGNVPKELSKIIEELQVSDYLEKPFAVSVLMSKIKKLISV